MASGSQLVIRKTRKHYVRGAEKVINIRDSLKKLLKPRTEDLSKKLIKTSDGILLMPSGVDLKTDQTAKADAGKLQITLVPRQIIRDIAKVRMYGNKKYGASDNWKQVSKERYRDAMCRHLLAYLDDPKGVDEESGLPHLAHLATNVAFLCEMEMWEDGKKM